ncbi:MAG: precorrin-4 C(11)-methyltransferase [Treponemataceae bacterium]
MIYFVGAGPGDPDLITVKGRRLLEKADMVIYAGSLVSDEHLKVCKKNCEKYNSAHMSLEEVQEKFLDAERKNYLTVRLHSGDPTIYGAIREQIDFLKAEQIKYEVVSGVSSFTAAAAVIGKEFTLPDVSQTIILTRMAGRTPVPEKENIKDLAAHSASMAIFLSVQQIDKLVFELVQGYGRDDVPCAVIYRATWEDQKIVLGTLSDIADKVKDAGIERQAQILVGDFLGNVYSRSKLYDSNFSHGFRKADK